MAQIDVAQVLAEAINEVATPEVDVAQLNAEIASEVTTPQVEVAQLFVEIAYRPDAKYYVYACEFDDTAIDNPDYMGQPMLGDRSAWDTVDHGSLHARDIYESSVISDKWHTSGFVGWMQIDSIAGTYTASTVNNVILCDGTFTVNLPEAATVTEKSYYIKNIGTGTITVDGYSSETIDNTTTISLSENDSVRIICDGSEWHIIAAWPAVVDGGAF